MDENSPIESLKDISAGDPISAKWLNRGMQSINRMNAGIATPQHIIKKPIASQTAGIVSIARLQLTVAGALSGLYAIDGVTPDAGDVILVTQGTAATDGLYKAAVAAWSKILLVSDVVDGYQVNVWDGNSAPTIYLAVT